MSPPTEERRPTREPAPSTEQFVAPNDISKTTATIDDGPLVARIVSVTPFRHTRSVVVLCPICTRRHQHGLPWPDGDEPERLGRTHRAAHCVGKLANRPGGYFIDPPSFPIGIGDVTTWGRPFPATQKLAVAS